MDFISRLRNSLRQTQQQFAEQENRNAEAAEQRARNQGEDRDESETSRSFVLSGNTSSAGSSTRLRVVRRDSGSTESNQRPVAREAAGGEEQEDQGPTIAQIVVNRLSQNERRQRITAAFLRRLTSSRESTVQQFQNMRRLIRLGRNRESGSDSDRFYFEDRSESSEDDIDSFILMQRKCEELENDNPDATPNKILVDEKFLMKSLNLSKNIPKQWIKKIIINEIDQESSMKICYEFGALGLLLYSSLRNLTFFDLEKKMLDSATARASSTSSDVQPQPLDFIRPVMLFYLNTIMEYCINNPDEMIDDIEVDPFDDGHYFTNIFCDEELSSSLITPSKENEMLKDDSMIVNPLMGTASTAASDSICAPSLDNSNKISSESKYEQEEMQQIRSSPTKKDKKQKQLIKNHIPKDQRFSLINLQNFMSVAPKTNQIRTGIRNMKTREIIIYKILLDMVGSYIRNFKTVSSKIYQKKYIPAVLEFYQKIDAEELGTVINTICDSLSSFKCRELNVNPEILQLLFIDVLQMPRNKEQREIILKSGKNCKEYYLWLYRKQLMEGRVMQQEQFHLKEFTPIEQSEKQNVQMKKVKF